MARESIKKKPAKKKGAKKKPAKQLLSTKAFGEIARDGVSDQQVRKWIKAGMPHREEPYRGRKRYLIDRDEGLAWLDQYHPDGINGGKRPGAGRPKGSKSKTATKVPQAIEADDEIEPSADLDEAQLRQLNAAQLSIQAQIEKILIDRRKRQAIEGKLVDAEEVGQIFRGRVLATQKFMMRLARSLSIEVIAAVDGDPAKTEKVRRVLDDRLAQACQSLCDPAFGPTAAELLEGRS